MAVRIYLKSATHGELTDHPFNGAKWRASDRFALDSDGNFRRDTMLSVTAVFGNEERSITAADFPGDVVTVKMWCAGKTVECRTLAVDAAPPLSR